MHTFDPGIRLPRRPYPGLRPFLDHEAALLFGRDEQIENVVDRLARKHFVAVIGGSGCGKSSLVRAGVVPRLRSFAIPGAGDFWMSLTSTPGTNLAQSEDYESSHTPIDRLARKFSQMLVPLAGDEEELGRQRQIAELFRLEGGFRRLVEIFGDELATPDGPSPKDVRLLFVIDQFEEIFHTSNKHSEDCALLVERLIDHYYDPHPRCYVMLTMRSENLNDCARFLEFPDIINSSSYLVRRLNAAELVDTIHLPCERFLRLLERQDVADLPETVAFEAAVIARLCDDAGELAYDTDHLPLLQHLLARLWHAACLRHGEGTQVPASIVWADLIAAVIPNAGSSAQLPANLNTLTSSLQNWPTYLYRLCDPTDRARINDLLRLLAYREPNTSVYTQQRVHAREFVEATGLPNTEALHRIVRSAGLVDGVDYLFWDAEDTASVTLKVSHEALIRGWSHFKETVDVEAARIETYVRALRDYTAWQKAGRSADASQYLLDDDELRRIDSADMSHAIGDRRRRGTWRPVLMLCRDATDLLQSESTLEEFLEHSREACRTRKRRERRTRLIALGATAAATLMIAAFGIQSLLTRLAGNSVLARVEKMTAVRESITSLSTPSQSLQTQTSLNHLLRFQRASAELSDARKPNAFDWAENYGLSSVLSLNVHRKLASDAELGIDNEFNRGLRGVLSATPWPVASAPAAKDGRTALPKNDFTCEVQGGTRSDGRVATFGQHGTLYLPGSGYADGSAPALFVVRDSGTKAIRLFASTYRHSTGTCVGAREIYYIPGFLNPTLALDANLRYLIVARGDSVSQPSGGLSTALTLHDLSWEFNTKSGRWNVQQRDPKVLIDDAAVDDLKKISAQHGVVALTTFPAAGGGILDVGGRYWRFVSSWRQDVSGTSTPPDLLALESAGNGTSCATIKTLLEVRAESGKPPESHRSQMLHSAIRPGYCFLVTSQAAHDGGDPGQPTPVANAANAATDDIDVPSMILLQVFAAAATDSATPRPIASSEWRVGSDPTQLKFFVGKTAEREGWIMVQRETRKPGDQPPPGDPALPMTAIPWSTAALESIANEILSKNAVADRQLTGL